MIIFKTLFWSPSRFVFLCLYTHKRYQLPIYVLIKPNNLRTKASSELNSNDCESESSSFKADKDWDESQAKSKDKKTTKKSKSAVCFIHITLLSIKNIEFENMNIKKTAVIRMTKMSSTTIWI